MAISKVVYGNSTLIDLTSDTIAAAKLLIGYTAHGADGAMITGTLPWRFVVQNTMVYLDKALVTTNTLLTPGSVSGTTLIL